MIAVQVDAGPALAGIRAARAATRGVPGAVHRAGAFAQTLVRANASTGSHLPGRRHIPGTGPGPNVATGDYRRSIALTTTEDDGVAEAEVSTAAVQAMRLENGFVGRDSAGRFYRQAAFPHWGPAEEPATEYADQEVDRVGDGIEGRSVADPLFATGPRLAQLVADLQAVLPAGVAAYAARPNPSTTTPFVVLDVTVRPARTALAGAWSRADMTLRAWSVHATPEQADALADLVRTWVLTEMATPGQMDVEPADDPYDDDPGGVPQVHEAWTVALTRT